MSQICDNTTPLGSKNASEILTETSAALQDAILDLQTLANQEAIDSLDRETVVVATNALNNILANTDLSSLSSLNEKFTSEIGITYTDLAEFAVGNSTDFSTLKDELVKFNANLPQAFNTNSTNQPISDETGQRIPTSTTGKTIDTGSGASEILGDSSRISQSSDLLADIQRLGNVTGLLSGRLPLELNVLPAILGELLNDLDFHFANELGSKLTDALCGAYNDVSASLSKAFAVVEAGKVVLSDLTNILEKDPKKLLEQLKQRATLETLVGTLESVINTAIKAAKKVALAAVGSVLLALKGMESAAGAIMKKMNKAINNINDYMEGANVKKIIADIEAVVASLASSFERLTPQNIANMMFKLCQMSQDLQAKLMEPSMKLNRMANSIATEAKALKSQNAVNVQSAVKYGAIRVSDATRQEKQKRADDFYANIKPTNQESDYITRAKPTSEEISTINTISDSGLGDSITFSSSVVNSKGWKEINNNVWARLLRIVAQTGESYEIKQAFVERTDSAKTGAVKMNAHNSGYAIDIVTTEGNRENTIVAASRAGFTGIGVYPNHLHLDLAGRRGFQSGFSGQTQTDIQALLNKHTIDGFKKKRS